MGAKNTKQGFNKYNLIAGIVLLAFVVFLLATDPLSWMDIIQVKLLVGLVILIIIVLSLSSLYKRGR